MSSATDLEFAATHGQLFHRRPVSTTSAHAQAPKLTEPSLLPALVLRDPASAVVV